jgi:hypothetical protein
MALSSLLSWYMGKLICGWLCHCRWLNQQLTDIQLGKLGAGGVSSRYLFRPPNGLAYPANNVLATRSVIDGNGTRPTLSSSSSIAPAVAFKPSIPSGHSFSTAPYNMQGGLASPLSLTCNINGMGSGVPNSFTTTAGSRPCCMAKAAAAAATAASTSSTTSKVQYRPAHLEKGPNATVNGDSNASASQCSMGLDSTGPTLWPDDSSSWMSKIGASTGVILPRPQLSFGCNTTNGSKSNGACYLRSGSGADCIQSRTPKSQSPESQSPGKAAGGQVMPNTSPRPKSPVRKPSTPTQSSRTFSPPVMLG